MTLEFWEISLTIFATTMASGGLWALIGKRFDKKSATTRLLLGLAHHRIVLLGMEYINRGWISKDEYQDFIHYLYEPYSQFGGNGLAERVKKSVDELPMRSDASPVGGHSQ